jgi:hypothetical protein
MVPQHTAPQACFRGCTQVLKRGRGGERKGRRSAAGMGVCEGVFEARAGWAARHAAPQGLFLEGGAGVA